MFRPFYDSRSRFVQFFREARFKKLSRIFDTIQVEMAHGLSAIIIALQNKCRTGHSRPIYSECNGQSRCQDRFPGAERPDQGDDQRLAMTVKKCLQQTTAKQDTDALRGLAATAQKRYFQTCIVPYHDWYAS